MYYSTAPYYLKIYQAYRQSKAIPLKAWTGPGQALSFPGG